MICGRTDQEDDMGQFKKMVRQLTKEKGQYFLRIYYHAYHYLSYLSIIFYIGTVIYQYISYTSILVYMYISTVIIVLVILELHHI